jgi:effector-binding domain-containing protein
MIEIKKSEYHVITKELLEADIEMYKKSLENWRNSEGIAKPYPNYLIVETIVENDAEWVFIDDESSESVSATHDELIDIDSENYDYSYARKSEYGSVEDQIEFITENGLEAWQAKVTEIKNKYPKPSK